MEILKQLVLLNNQVDDLRLQDKLGEQNFRDNIKKKYEPLNDAITDTSRDITKTLTESSIKNNKAISDFDGKVSKLMNENAMIATYLGSSVINLFKPRTKVSLS